MVLDAEAAGFHSQATDSGNKRSDLRANSVMILTAYGLSPGGERSQNGWVRLAFNQHNGQIETQGTELQQIRFSDPERE